MSQLPTPKQMLERAETELIKARESLSNARLELLSDWPPGWEMTRDQAERRAQLFRAIDDAKSAIDAMPWGAL